MVEAFKIPISLELDAKSKSFVEDLKNSVSGVANKAGVGGGAVAGGVAGGLIGTGIGAILEVVGKILSNFKGLMNLAGTVIKVLVEFLRPIADVIMLLLMPILQILKPILIVVRQIMAPFRQIAFNLSKEGAQALREGDQGKAAGLFGLSIAESLLGVQAVFSFLTAGIIEQLTTLGGETLKLLTSAIGNLFRPLLEFFGINVDKAIIGINNFIDNGIKGVNDAIKVSLGIALSAQQLGIAELAAKLGVDISSEFTTVNDTLREFLVGSDNSFVSKFDELTTDFENRLIPEMGNALDSMVSKFETAAERINNINVRGGGTSFGRRLFTTVTKGPRAALEEFRESLET